MLELLNKLSSRRAERQKQDAASWAELVSDVCDERMQDPDAILTGLERLGKTPEELQRACDLLVQRREWASQAAAGDAAEASYPGLTDQEAAAERELEKLVESHQRKQIPLQNKLEAARSAISVAADARRRLAETAGDESKRVAFDAIDADLAALQAEQLTLLKSLTDRKRWVHEIESRGQSAATEDLARLPSAREGLKDLQRQDAELRSRQVDLQSRRNAAAQMLLRPENF